jgi:AraC-like DNA-binding protein
MYSALVAEQRQAHKQARLSAARLQHYQQLLSQRDAKHEAPAEPPPAQPLSAEEADLDALFRQVLEALQHQARYTQPDLVVRDIAEALGVPQARVSRAVNRVAGRNFNELVNDLRVQEAKRLLASPQTAHYTIEAIGTLAGFSSRSNFFSVFKRSTNLTPSAFRANASQGHG